MISILFRSSLFFSGTRRATVAGDITGPNDASGVVWAYSRHREPCLLCRKACVGLRWPSLGAVGLRGPALAFRGLLWACVGLRWPSLAAVGFRGLSWWCGNSLGPEKPTNESQRLVGGLLGLHLPSTTTNESRRLVGGFFGLRLPSIATNESR